MEKPINSTHREKIMEYINKVMCRSELNNEDLVQIIEHCGFYLNLRSIPQYAKENNMSYNGVKKHRNIIRLLGFKVVIDNH